MATGLNVRLQRREVKAQHGRTHVATTRSPFARNLARASLVRVTSFQMQVRRGPSRHAHAVVASCLDEWNPGSAARGLNMSSRTAATGTRSKRGHARTAWGRGLRSPAQEGSGPCRTCHTPTVLGPIRRTFGRTKRGPRYRGPAK